MQRRFPPPAALAALLLATCAVAPGPATFNPAAPTATMAAGSVSQTAAATPSPTTASLATASATAAGQPPPSSSYLGDYLDDRSSPEAVLRSYVNALNRREYVRAYSYWEPGAAASHLPPYPEFERGFAQTASVRLTLGVVRGDAGAGQVYFAVPTVLVATTTEGATQVFAGCYVLHLAQPAIQGTPPFQPMGIRDAAVRQVPSDTNALEVAAQSCAALIP